MINLEDMGSAGKLETEDQESFASIKEAAAKLHARQMARWRRKPEQAPPPIVRRARLATSGDDPGVDAGDAQYFTR